MSSKIKKIASTLLCATLMMTLLAGCGGRSTDVPQTEETDLTNDSKVLVVYFSWSGHLQTMSHWIADETGGDIVRVVTKEPYPEDYNATADRAKKEQDDGTRPEITIELTEEELSKYDTIFLGFPVWWYDLPMPMWTFLESADLSGKTVIPFFSHEGSSNGASSLGTIEKLAEGAEVKSSDALSIRGGSVDSSEEEVREWVRNLGYGK